MSVTTRPQEVLRQLRDEIVEYARQVRRQRGCERLWGDAESFGELCALMQRFVLGELILTPGHSGPRCPETVEIAGALAHANGQGFLTTGSQNGREWVPCPCLAYDGIDPMVFGGKLT